MKLDAKTVTGLKLPDGKVDAIHFDDSTSRLRLRLRASGTAVRKSWVVQYRRARRHAAHAAGLGRRSERRSGAGGGEEDPGGDRLGARPAG